MMLAPQPDRLAGISSLAARSTSNPDPATSLTIMEAVAHVAGLPISTAPTCTDPRLAAFLTMWSEELPDIDRNELLPLVLDLVGAHHKRPDHFPALALSWLLRGPLVDWLDAAELSDEISNLGVFPAPTTPSALARWSADLEEMRARIGALSVRRTGKTPASHWAVDHVVRMRHETAEAAAAEIVKDAFGDDSVEARVAEFALCNIHLSMVLTAQAALDRLDAEGHPDPFPKAIAAFVEHQRAQHRSAIALARRMMGSRPSI